MDTPDLNPSAQTSPAAPVAENVDEGRSDGKPATVTGQVVEALPNTLFRVLVEGRSEPVLAYLGGKMRLHRIRVLIGDRVEIVPDPYGGRARIVRRL